MFFAVFIMFYLSFTVVLTNEYDEVEEPLLPDDSFVQDVEQDDGYDAYAKIIPRSNSNSDCVQKILGSLRESVQKIQQDLSDLEKYVVSSDSSKTETATEIESPTGNGDNSENCDTESPTGAGGITPLNVTIEDSPAPPSGNEFECNNGATGSGNTGTNSGSNIDANSGGNIGGNVGDISGSNVGSVNNSSSSSNTECENPQANHDSKSKAWDKQVTVCKEILQNTNKNLMEALAGLFPEKRRTIKIRTKKRNHHEKNQNSKRNDFSWSEWSSWSPCSVSCGSGKQIRYRKCAGEGCQADIEMDHRQCFKPNCDQDLYKVLRMF